MKGREREGLELRDSRQIPAGPLRPIYFMQTAYHTSVAVIAAMAVMAPPLTALIAC